MAPKRQKRKQILTVHRQIVTADRLELTFRIERNQTLNDLLFLILKTASRLARRRSAPQRTLATAAAYAFGEPQLKLATKQLFDMELQRQWQAYSARLPSSRVNAVDLRTQFALLQKHLRMQVTSASRRHYDDSAKA